MNSLVFVGNRAAANRAATRLGISPLVVPTTSSPPTSLKNCLARLHRRFGRTGPAAVLAVTEDAVPLAACLQQHFSLPGLSVETAMAACDKRLMKRLVAGGGIPCAPRLEITERTNAVEVRERLGLPVVLKVPVSSGGRGVCVVRSFRELTRRLRPGLLAESFIRGTEMSVECFHQNGQLLFRNQTRYLVPGWASLVPAGLPNTTAEQVDKLVTAAHLALGIGDGISHLELFLTEDGPVFGEIAVRPPGGRIMELIESAYGFDPWEALIRLGMGESFSFPTSCLRFSAAYLLHPPPGRVRRVSGVARARKAPGVVEVSCRVRAGQEIPPRLGTGQIKGHIFVRDPDAARCEKRLRSARRAIRFEVDKPVHHPTIQLRPSTVSLHS